MRVEIRRSSKSVFTSITIIKQFNGIRGGVKKVKNLLNYSTAKDKLEKTEKGEIFLFEWNYVLLRMATKKRSN